MSRTICSPGLRALCEQKGRAIRERFQVADVACLCHCAPSSLYRYSTGRKSLPHLERKIAGVFGLTVEQLRARLFPVKSALKRTKRGGE